MQMARRLAPIVSPFQIKWSQCAAQLVANGTPIAFLFQIKWFQFADQLVANGLLIDRY